MLASCFEEIVCAQCSVMFDPFVTLWTVACLAPLSMGFSRQEYWSGLPFPPEEDLLKPGIESYLLLGKVDSLPLSHEESPSAPQLGIKTHTPCIER